MTTGTRHPSTSHIADGRSGARGGGADDLGGLATWLFVLMLLFYLITTTPFADLNGASHADPQAGNSNLLNQIAALALTAGFIVCGARHPLARETVFQPRALLLPLFGWLFLAALTSASPDVALRKTVLEAMTCVDASIFLLLPRSSRHFAKLLLVGTAVMLAVAYAGVVALPNLAIHQGTEAIEPEHAGLWHGQFPHKNVAAAVMVLSFFVGMFTYGAGFRLASLAAMALSAVFLAHTGGKSAISYLPATLAVAWVFERWRWSRLPIVVGGPLLFTFVAIGCALSEGLSDFVASLGIDPTFTARTDIWRVAFDAIAWHPILGYGFGNFWQTDQLFYSGGVGIGWAVQAFNGHNSWIDILLTAGFPAFVMVFAWLVALPLRDIGRAERSGNDPALTRLFTRIWLYGLFQSCLESIFLQGGDFIWFALLFSVFGLRYQASARTIERPAPAVWPLAAPAGGGPTRPELSTNRDRVRPTG